MKNQQKIPSKGLSKRHNRANKFKISRHKDDFGFHVYTLENTAKREKIQIKRFIFDRFRNTMKTLEDAYTDNEPLNEIKVFYRSKAHFVISQKLNEKQQYIIQELDHNEVVTNFLSFDIEAISSINKLLYHEKLFHPSDLLTRLISYHKLFRFSFSEKTDSITSKLSIKTEFLYSFENHKRKLRAIFQQKVKTVEVSGNITPKSVAVSEAEQQNFFKSRLAEKVVTSNTAVDYDQLFNDEKPPPPPSAEPKPSKAVVDRLTLPLHCQDLKNFLSTPFTCQLTTNEFSDFLRFVANDRHGEFLLGFEIIDCLFKQFGSLKTFKFPLYYLKVTLKESGKEIILQPTEDGKFYLNHLALANLVEKYSKSKSADNINNFFKTLLAQHLSIHDKPTRISLTRILPITEEIFTQVRKILFGAPQEKGKGGILFNLTSVGIEIDLDSVVLYRPAKIQSLTAASLERDLDQILQTAYEYPARFYNSNLGNFLSPETCTTKQRTFSERAWVPKALPKSFSNLLRKLNEHNLVLLEGPPGTGKTHSILNLLIHCICDQKKLLVVSDQESAIHALLEKLKDFAIDKEDPKKSEQIIDQGVKIIDRVPKADASMANWASELKKMLIKPKEAELVSDKLPNYEMQVKQLDDEIELLSKELQNKMNEKFSPRHYHETTSKDIESIVSFIRFTGCSRQNRKDSAKNPYRQKLVSNFIELRQQLTKIPNIYRYFRFPSKMSEYNQEVLVTRALVNRLLKTKPKSYRQFKEIFAKQPNNPVTVHLDKEWQRLFPDNRNSLRRAIRWLTALVWHPLASQLRMMRKIFNNQLALLEEANSKVLFQLNKIHHHLRSPQDQPSCLAYEIFITNFMATRRNKPSRSVQEILQEIEQRQEQRDKIIKTRFVLNLSDIAYRSQKAGKSGQPDAMTTIAALIDSLTSYDSLEMALPVVDDLRDKLLATFPVWICRKQAVSFLFPCASNIFDLVIVDEATQCRVDDAMPLLFRANKLMVVGDDKQTVLAKNSPVDDYLFFEFGLDEHLRKTQGQALKGGGSHIFGLVKQIKQASLMLDEHYRCPPEIIAFSNKYVYHNDLKMMQWGGKDSVIIDHSEQRAESNIRQSRGMYKGIETEMLDRFLQFVQTTVEQIEQQEKIKINVETDVALCYFLLKNEPYIKAKKGEFLRKLNRGNDVLDGAGAALQGKERDYIFYLWDINRGNMVAFRHGDEEDKRKGELNVLMSRPKKRAYHYLHKDFASLNHRTATISDYLWHTYQKQQEVQTREEFVQRVQNPTATYSPWRRYSGQLIEKILGENLRSHKLTSLYSVNIGDPNFCIDLIVEAKPQSVGVIDLSRFAEEQKPAESIIAYYFQIKRATPQIQPYFTFIKNIASNSSVELRDLAKIIERIIKNSS